MNDQQSRNLLPLIIGMVLTGILLATLAYLARIRNDVESRGTPQLSIVAPTPGSVTDSPLVIRFRSTEPIELQPTGWGYRRLHLHASVAGVEYMPAATEIETIQPGSYDWTIPAVRAGVHRLYVGWADMSHRPITPGASDTVTVEMR